MRRGKPWNIVQTHGTTAEEEDAALRCIEGKAGDDSPNPHLGTQMSVSRWLSEMIFELEVPGEQGPLRLKSLLIAAQDDNLVLSPAFAAAEQREE
jgi:hypothetical protein